MFKKDTSIRHWCVICMCGAETQMIEIKASDSPFGYASIGAEQNFGGYTGKESKEVAIQDKQELAKYAKMGGYVIYVDGLIDLSEGKIPQNGKSLGLDKFISEISGGEFKLLCQIYAGLRCFMPCIFRWIARSKASRASQKFSQ